MEFKQLTKPYHTDHRIVSSCHYHAIFCPKYRRNVLNDVLAARLKELIRDKRVDDGYILMELEVMPDHVHLLLDVARALALRRWSYASKPLRRTTYTTSSPG